MMVEVGKAKKRLKVLHQSWFRPGNNGIKFLWVHLDAVSTNDVAQILDFRFVPFTFSRVDREVMVTKSMQDKLDMFVVLFLSPGEDKDIVKINNANHIKKISKGILNKRLKGSWHIS
jgi:hypothetical protein